MNALARTTFVSGVVVAVVTMLIAETAKPAGKVTLKTDQVSIVEITATADKCPNQKGTTARLKVAGQESVDVMVRYRLVSGRIEKLLRDQKPNEEFSVQQCVSNAKFEVLTRPRGSRPEDWAKVK